ncbi:MAG: hypothetical protein HC840_00985 [Leptolyngbyaceae cyanobacterium RM2_2_4]|nr:hypothetical protein [Leptolyngbyaceae cyanobacterium RM2_2_4]
MEEKKFYVYIHIDPRDKSVRYVGKGTGDRAWRLKRRSGKHKSWLKSLESKGLLPVIEIVEYFSSEKEALTKEADLIKSFMISEPKFCNMIDGGIGCPSGSRHPMFGRKHTEETKLKMRKSGKGKRKSAQHRENIGLAHKGKPKNPESIRKRVLKVLKSILCIESGSIFNSVKEASEQTGVDASSIVRICKGKQKMSWNKLTFRYL